MSFVYPNVLFFLVIVGVLGFLYKSKNLSTLEGVFSQEVLKKISFDRKSFFSKKFKFYLSLVALVLMILALARPVMINESEKNTVIEKSFNLVVVLDISKSMNAKDIFPSRLEFAKKALEKLMEKLPSANIALIAFAKDAFLVSPFSNDFESITFLLEHLDTDSLSTSGSEVKTALESAIKLYDSTSLQERTVLLISDGADGKNYNEILNTLVSGNLILHVLGIGTKEGISLDDGNGGFIKDKEGNIVISKRDDSFSIFAQKSGGAFLGSSGDISKLEWLASEIKDSVSTQEITRDRFAGAQELFYYPLGAALVLLFFLFSFTEVFFFLHVCSFLLKNLEAGLFDFWYEKEAKSSYEKQEFQLAEENYKKLTDSEARYNEANALYKQDKFQEAIKLYENLKGFSGEKEYQRLHNLGNAYAKSNQIDKAIENYEKALKIQEDEDTKFNLELLKKQKKQEQKNKEQKNKENEKQEKKKGQDEQKNSQNKQDKKDEKDEKQNQSKEKNEQQNKQDNAEQKEQKKMSEAEAKKWENRMNQKEFKTQPYRLQKSQKGQNNEITW